MLLTIRTLLSSWALERKISSEIASRGLTELDRAEINPLSEGRGASLARSTLNYRRIEVDESQLASIANQVAGHLDWVISFDGDGQIGSGMIFAGATVGTTLGAATVCLAPINNVWVAELTQHVGSVRQNEPAKSLVLQTTGDPTAADAWKSLMDLAESCFSLKEGLDCSTKERGVSERLHAVGLVGVDFKVNPAQ